MNHPIQHRSWILETGTFSVLALAVLSAVLMTSRPAQAQIETVLYNFPSAPANGPCCPQSNLVFDNVGNLYGTSPGVSGEFEEGIVYELSPVGNGVWSETILYNFTGGADGGNPAYSGLIFDSQGNLYGTASGGGANGDGVVFELSPVEGGWTETVLYNFCSLSGCADGGRPIGGLLMDKKGNLYGSNSIGIYELSPSSSNWTEQVITTQSNGEFGLAMDAAGNLYGYGSNKQNPTIIKLSPNGEDGWNSVVLHTFPKQTYLFFAPVLDKAGNIYAITIDAGTHGEYGNYEKVWKGTVKKNGRSQWKTVATFLTCDGASFGGVTLDASGNIYGIGCGNREYAVGFAYELVAPVGTGNYEENVLWNFDGTDGSLPFGTLIWDNAGNLYGVTLEGGSYQDCYDGNGCGVAFEITP
jgi:uncharacterized repeat protein (TIGR03803 family)